MADNKDSNRLRLVVVDDHQMFRSGVIAELSGTVDVVGTAGTVAEAVAVIADRQPDVVLLDVHLPDGTGASVITATRKNNINTTFLALSVSDAAEDVISVIRAGARGYVTKTISGGELVDAVARVADGDAVFSPRLAGFVLDAFCAPDAEAGAGVVDAPAVDEKTEKDPGPNTGHTDPVIDALTRRELEVLKLLARGYTYKEIGEKLFISIKTVETHASNILRKTQQSNRHALARWAVSHDLD